MRIVDSWFSQLWQPCIHDYSCSMKDHWSSAKIQSRDMQDWAEDIFDKVYGETGQLKVHIDGVSVDIWDTLVGLLVSRAWVPTHTQLGTSLATRPVAENCWDRVDSSLVQVITFIILCILIFFMWNIKWQNVYFAGADMDAALFHWGSTPKWNNKVMTWRPWVIGDLQSSNHWGWRLQPRSHGPRTSWVFWWNTDISSQITFAWEH